MSEIEHDGFISELRSRDALAIVACESGGAKLLAAMIGKLGEDRPPSTTFHLAGPAVTVFNDKLDNIANRQLEDIADLKGAAGALVLTGTSWMPDFERRAIALAKKNGTEVWSVLDHWTNFRERFLPVDAWDGDHNADNDAFVKALPDRVIVCDDYALVTAKSAGFPEDILLQAPNYAMLDFKRKYKEQLANAIPAHDKRRRILYVSEPIADDLKATYGDERHWGYTEFELIKDIVKAKPNDAVVRLRLHPNESIDKYKGMFPADSDGFEISSEREIIKDFIWADAVAGVHSMALVMALEAGIPAYSYIPADARQQCALPHQEIRRTTNPSEIFD